jgi:tRNA(Arg) A34 adenosine deaminase TadA
MCLGAMVHARIEKVVFGAFDERTGVCGSCQDLSESKCFNDDKFEIYRLLIFRNHVNPI